MTSFIAFLRGINVGGRNKVSMAALKAMLASLGFEDVVTYVQSGNVVFRGSGRPDQIAAVIEKQIAKDFGVNASVLIRTPGELRKVAKGNPFLSEEADLSKLHVLFLDRAPAAKAKAELDPGRSPPDRFRMLGREIYMHLPNGFGRTKLTIDYFERRLGVHATARNWRTLNKVLELAEG